jgi:hypothetical protein
MLNVLFLVGFGATFFYAALTLGTANATTILELLFILIFVILGLGVVQPWARKRQNQFVETGRLLLVSITCILGCLFGAGLILIGVIYAGGLITVASFVTFVIYYLNILWVWLAG